VGWKKGKGIDKNLKICYKISTSNQNIKIRGIKSRWQGAINKSPCLSARNSFKWVGAGNSQKRQKWALLIFVDFDKIE
jgi:hypothetical protein